MARINRMQIAGIRSFHPNNPQTIEFYSPSTLILGKNGYGKTTILEALKYVLTNEQPPNSKNGAFITDPSLFSSNCNQTKASVKLKFIGKDNEEMLIKRSILLTRNGNTFTTKTTEANLMYESENNNLVNDNKRAKKYKSFDGKISDIDSEVLEKLDLKKGLIDNVLLVHQTDFTWPLSDPGTLKKRLDLILEASKHVKFVDTLKNHKKELLLKIRLLKQKLEYSLNDKIKGSELQRDISVLKDKITKKVEFLENHNHDLERRRTTKKAIEEKFEALNEKYFRFNELFQKLKNTNESSLCVSEVEIKEEEKRSLKKKYSSQTKEDLLKKLNKISYEIEKQEKLEEEHFKKIRQNEVNKKLKKNIEEEFLKNLQNIFSSFGRNKFVSNIKNLKIEGSPDFGKLGRVEKNIQYIEEKVICNLETLIGCKNEFYTKTVSLFQLFSKVEKHRREIKDFLKNDNKDEGSDEDNEKLMKLEESISNKMGECSKLSEMMNSKEYKRNDKIFDDFDLENNKFSIDQLTTNVNLFVSFNSLQVKRIEILRKIEKKYENIDFILNNKNILDKIKRNPESVKYLNDNSIAKGNLTTIEISFELYNKIYLSGSRSKACPFCNSKTEGTKFMEKLEAILRKLREKREDIQGEIDSKAGEKFDINISEENIKKIKEILKNIELTKKSLIMIDKEIKEKFDIDFASINENINNENLIEKSNFIKTFSSLNYENHLIGHYCNLQGAILSLQKKNKTALEYLNTLGSIDFEDFMKVNMNSVLRELNQLKKDREIIFQALKKNENVEYKKKFLEDTISDLVSKIDNEKNDFLCDYSKLMIRVEECSSIFIFKNNEFHFPEATDIEDKKFFNFTKSINKVLNTFEKHLIEYKNGINEFVIETKHKINNLKMEFNRAKNIFIYENLNEKFNNNQIDRSEYFELQKYIKFLEFDEKKKLLKQNLKFFNEIKDFIFAFNSENTEENLEISKIMGDSNKKKNKKDRIIHELSISEPLLLEKDYVRYFKILKEVSYEFLSDIKSELIIMKNDRTERKNIIDEMRKLKFQSEGKIEEMKKNQRLKEIEYDKNYLNVEQIYKDSFIELKILELYQKDINTALLSAETGLIEYHNTKINEINDVLRRLWKNICGDSDIEYIELKLEMGKSYNYKMVMYKSINNKLQELDMRGRCSAGQSVITSIILRLALSEVFIHGSTLFALDEPTTNLDESTIEGLAEILKSIFLEFSNHQFIIITHDEKFLMSINNNDPYFKLKRNKGFSIIEKYDQI